MNTHNLYYKELSIFSLIILIALSACKKETAIHRERELAPLSIEFDNFMGQRNLVLNYTNYTNTAGETYNIQLLQYFISNIKLKRSDGTIYPVNPDSSYFLIKEDYPKTRFARVKVPEGDYVALIFTLGIDSLRSTMDISKRTGVLEPSGETEESMYWGWNSGYIFLKMEGLCNQAPLDPTGNRKYRYHIGGFGGYSTPTINNLKVITLDLTARGIVQARKGRNVNIHVMADISKILSGSTTVSIAANPQVMFSDYSIKIANNYATMFVHDHTDN